MFRRQANQCQAGIYQYAAPVERGSQKASPIPMCGRNTLHRGRRLLGRRYNRNGLFLLIGDTKKCPGFYKSLYYKDLFCRFRRIQPERYAPCKYTDI